MFKCQVTGRMTRPGQKMNKVVIETRDKEYTERQRVDGVWQDVVVGYGYETVKEISVSDEGLRILQQRAEQEGV